MKKFKFGMMTLGSSALPLLAEETGGSGSTTGVDGLLATASGAMTDALSSVWPIIGTIVAAGLAIWLGIKAVGILRKSFNKSV